MSDPFHGQRQALTYLPPRLLNLFYPTRLPCPSSKYLSFYIASTLNIFIVFLLFFSRFSLNFLLGCTHTHIVVRSVCVCVCGLMCMCVCVSQDLAQYIVAFVENVFNLIAPTFFATVPFGSLCSAPLRFGTFYSPWIIVSGMSVRCQRQDVRTPGRLSARRSQRSRCSNANASEVCAPMWPGMRNCRQR